MPTEQVVTPNGWRFVGKAAALVSDVSPARDSIAPGRDQDALFAARFQLRPRIGSGSVVPTVLETLHLAIAREWQDAPPLTPDRPLHRSPGRFHGLDWLALRDDSTWTGELIWRHAHPVVAGAPCTTHVIVEERPGYSHLAVRVTADDGYPSVRGLAGAGQARPVFLTELARALRLLHSGSDCAPVPLEDEAIEDFVRDVLLSETREAPVAVLSPLEQGGYVVPPAELVEELLGLTRLYVIHRHQSTFRLTDSLGDKRLSCYWGALRVYMPGFSCAERPDEHPLLVHDRLIDPVIRAGLVGRLGRYAGVRLHMPPGVADRQARAAAASQTAAAEESPRAYASREPGPAPASLPRSIAGSAPPATAATAATAAAGPAALESDAAALAAALGQLPGLLGALDARLGALGAAITQLVSTNAQLGDEIARLRTTTALRSSGTTSLERRFDALVRVLQQHLAAESPGEEDGRQAESASPSDEDIADEREGADTPSLVDILRQAATDHADALLVLDPAEQAAADSPYEDADRLSVVLDAMAAVARRRQEGALGTSLRSAFRELGIDYRGGISPSTSEKHRRQYLVHDAGGHTFDCHEHIVLGTSYDPRHCLRIYFTSRAPVEPRFVIGHVGRHFEVGSTT